MVTILLLTLFVLAIRLLCKGIVLAVDFDGTIANDNGDKLFASCNYNLNHYIKTLGILPLNHLRMISYILLSIFTGMKLILFTNRGSQELEELTKRNLGIYNAFFHDYIFGSGEKELYLMNTNQKFIIIDNEDKDWREMPNTIYFHPVRTWTTDTTKKVTLPIKIAVTILIAILTGGEPAYGNEGAPNPIEASTTVVDVTPCKDGSLWSTDGQNNTISERMDKMIYFIAALILAALSLLAARVVNAGSKICCRLEGFLVSNQTAKLFSWALNGRRFHLMNKEEKDDMFSLMRKNHKGKSTVKHSLAIKLFFYWLLGYQIVLETEQSKGMYKYLKRELGIWRLLPHTKRFSRKETIKPMVQRRKEGKMKKVFALSVLLIAALFCSTTTFGAEPTSEVIDNVEFTHNNHSPEGGEPESGANNAGAAAYQLPVVRTRKNRKALRSLLPGYKGDIFWGLNGVFGYPASEQLTFGQKKLLNALNEAVKQHEAKEAADKEKSASIAAGAMTELLPIALVAASIFAGGGDGDSTTLECSVAGLLALRGNILRDALVAMTKEALSKLATAQKFEGRSKPKNKAELVEFLIEKIEEGPTTKNKPKAALEQVKPLPRSKDPVRSRKSGSSGKLVSLVVKFHDYRKNNGKGGTAEIAVTLYENDVERCKKIAFGLVKASTEDARVIDSCFKALNVELNPEKPAKFGFQVFDGNCGFFGPLEDLKKDFVRFDVKGDADFVSMAACRKFLSNVMNGKAAIFPVVSGELAVVQGVSLGDIKKCYQLKYNRAAVSKYIRKDLIAHRHNVLHLDPKKVEVKSVKRRDGRSHLKGNRRTLVHLFPECGPNVTGLGLRVWSPVFSKDRTSLVVDETLEDGFLVLETDERNFKDTITRRCKKTVLVTYWSYYQDLSPARSGLQFFGQGEVEKPLYPNDKTKMMFVDQALQELGLIDARLASSKMLRAVLHGVFDDVFLTHGLFDEGRDEGEVDRGLSLQRRDELVNRMIAQGISPSASNTLLHLVVHFLKHWSKNRMEVSTFVEEFKVTIPWSVQCQQMSKTAREECGRVNWELHNNHDVYFCSLYKEIVIADHLIDNSHEMVDPGDEDGDMAVLILLTIAGKQWVLLTRHPIGVGGWQLIDPERVAVGWRHTSWYDADGVKHKTTPLNFKALPEAKDYKWKKITSSVQIDDANEPEAGSIIDEATLEYEESKRRWAVSLGSAVNAMTFILSTGNRKELEPIELQLIADASQSGKVNLATMKKLHAVVDAMANQKLDVAVKAKRPVDRALAMRYKMSGALRGKKIPVVDGSYTHMLKRLVKEWRKQKEILVEKIKGTVDYRNNNVVVEVLKERGMTESTLSEYSVAEAEYWYGRLHAGPNGFRFIKGTVPLYKMYPAAREMMEALDEMPRRIAAEVVFRIYVELLRRGEWDNMLFMVTKDDLSDFEEFCAFGYIVRWLELGDDDEPTPPTRPKKSDKSDSEPAETVEPEVIVDNHVHIDISEPYEDYEHYDSVPVEYSEPELPQQQPEPERKEVQMDAPENPEDFPQFVVNGNLIKVRRDKNGRYYLVIDGKTKYIGFDVISKSGQNDYSTMMKIIERDKDLVQQTGKVKHTLFENLVLSGLFFAALACTGGDVVTADCLTADCATAMCAGMHLVVQGDKKHEWNIWSDKLRDLKHSVAKVRKQLEQREYALCCHKDREPEGVARKQWCYTLNYLQCEIRDIEEILAQKQHELECHEAAEPNEIPVKRVKQNKRAFDDYMCGKAFLRGEKWVNKNTVYWLTHKGCKPDSPCKRAASNASEAFIRKGDWCVQWLSPRKGKNISTYWGGDYKELKRLLESKKTFKTSMWIITLVALAASVMFVA